MVGVVEVASITPGKDFVPDPKLAFTRIELVPFEHELETPAADLLTSLSELRHGGDGQLSFRFDGARADEAKGDEAAEALELDAGPGYYFRVVDAAPGRFDFLLCTQHVEGVRKRGDLVREEWSEIPPGDYLMHQLDEAFQSMAAVLVEEWESNDGGVIVDAEVVDDEAVEAGE